MKKEYRIAVAGTGYVGLSIATLLSQHHHVTAVDIIPEKVEMINNRKSPIQDDYIEKYLAELKSAWSESVAEIKTGNPVTDVILTQKQKEAEEKGIDFRCKFMYPTDTGINAFDVSVILNNAITNAFEGVSGCKNPYVSISAYRKKNAYMLELTNCIRKRVEIDDETGLPESTKKDKGSHGFGLANIRKVAQKYYGDIDISQDENSFTLTVMLMVE